MLLHLLRFSLYPHLRARFELAGAARIATAAASIYVGAVVCGGSKIAMLMPAFVLVAG